MAAEQLQHNLYIDVSHVSGSSEYRPGCSTCRWKGAITGRPETAAEETVLHVEGRAAERQRGTAKGDFALDPDHDLYIHASQRVRLEHLHGVLHHVSVERRHNVGA